MKAILTCTSVGTGEAPHRSELRLKLGGVPENADYGNIGYVFVQLAPLLLKGTDYELTIGTVPAPAGTPLLRAKLRVTAANTTPDGKFSAALRMVVGDPLNAGMSSANLAITVISHQEFVVGNEHVVDIDLA